MDPILNMRRILWCLRSQSISADRDPKNWTACHNGRKLNSHLNGRTPNWLLIKNLKFSGPSLLGMMSSTLQHHFLCGVYYDKWWLSYLLCTSIKLHPMTRIVQSLTKQNDKIWLTKNDLYKNLLPNYITFWSHLVYSNFFIWNKHSELTSVMDVSHCYFTEKYKFLYVSVILKVFLFTFS